MSVPRYLLDTHVLLWSLNRDPRLSPRHFELIEAQESLIVSVASIWEIAIKRALGKLTTADDPIGHVRRRAIGILPIVEAHATGTAALPPHHRDPFDRLLISQARAEGLTILTSDRRFTLYDVPLG